MTDYNTSDWPALPPLHLLTDTLDDYQQFLSTKMAVPKPVGIDVSADKINPKLYLFQRDIVRWALQLGRAAIFADVGLGKTGMQLEWAFHVAAAVLPCAKWLSSRTLTNKNDFGFANVNCVQGRLSRFKWLSTSPFRAGLYVA